VQANRTFSDLLCRSQVAANRCSNLVFEHNDCHIAQREAGVATKGPPGQDNIRDSFAR
jgi:hypothetical protein